MTSLAWYSCRADPRVERRGLLTWVAVCGDCDWESREFATKRAAQRAADLWHRGRAKAVAA